MNSQHEIERVQTVVIGGGQSGLSVGYFLKRRGVPFVILDAKARIGDAWRKRWDSLRLFTPARYDGLAGMPFPARGDAFPTKDEMADYLEAYAARFDLPVRTGVRVDRLSKRGERFLVTAGQRQIEADQVVVAMANYQVPKVPPFASSLASNIVQLPSLHYRSPAQLQEGGVLVVGAGNSGAEIAMDAARGHRVWMSGRDVGQIPFKVDGFLGRLLVPVVFRLVFHRILTLGTPMGRKFHAKDPHRAVPLIRTKRGDLGAAGVELVPRVVGVADGRPVLADGRTLDVTNVIWCTGFDAGFSWIDLPIFDADGDPRHERGVVSDQPGLYFVGLNFLYSVSSTMIHGVARDAERIAEAVAVRSHATATVPGRERVAPTREAVARL